MVGRAAKYISRRRLSFSFFQQNFRQHSLWLRKSCIARKINVSNKFMKTTRSPSLVFGTRCNLCSTWEFLEKVFYTLRHDSFSTAHFRSDWMRNDKLTFYEIDRNIKLHWPIHRMCAFVFDHQHSPYTVIVPFVVYFNLSVCIVIRTAWQKQEKRQNFVLNNDCYWIVDVCGESIRERVYESIWYHTLDIFGAPTLEP